jgi:hypothetical protein
MWKCQAIYDSQPYNVIVTLEGELYRVLKVSSTTSTSLILKKQ